MTNNLCSKNSSLTMITKMPNLNKTMITKTPNLNQITLSTPMSTHSTITHLSTNEVSVISTNSQQFPLIPQTTIETKIIPKITTTSTIILRPNLPQNTKKPTITMQKMTQSSTKSTTQCPGSMNSFKRVKVSAK